ncbi:MAG: alpha/beta fold hydrolase [Deltaproteobacteria bacterium]|jgi:surfactin synthase thioesterase subunit|nr:alpha/beta fold hydrolase [Deltaproteobacteria bacterium]
MILFLLAHAGGFAQAYAVAFKELANRLAPKGLELIGLDLPGHGGRIDEPLLESLQDMTADLSLRLADELKARPDKSYLVFGHSLGGLLGYLMTAELPEDQAPKHLFMSSTCVPGLMPVGHDFIEMDNDTLWRASSQRFGALRNDLETTGQLTSGNELIEIFAPILRSDLSAVINQNYQPWPHSQVPTTLFYSNNDIVSGLDMAKWQAYFSKPIEIIKCQGGHFHSLENPTPLINRLVKVIETL